MPRSAPKGRTRALLRAHGACCCEPVAEKPRLMRFCRSSSAWIPLAYHLHGNMSSFCVCCVRKSVLAKRDPRERDRVEHDEKLAHDSGFCLLGAHPAPLVYARNTLHRDDLAAKAETWSGRASFEASRGLFSRCASFLDTSRSAAHVG